MIYQNTEAKSSFFPTIKKEFRHATDVQIASGYVSNDIVNTFAGDFKRISANDGRARLLIGMAFYEGLPMKTLDILSEMSETLEGNNNGSGVFVSPGRRYHGKVYSFGHGENRNVYLGSSNFSRSGLGEGGRGNFECTARINQPDLKLDLENHLENVFSEKNAISILRADIKVPGSHIYRSSLKLDALDKLKKFEIGSIDLNILSYFDMSLVDRVVHPKSNFNTYFGKGRKSPNGNIAPRPWYEIELIAPKKIRTHPLYPRGQFTAYTDDGYIIPMVTNGEDCKNIRSLDGLATFGQWIKGKLQNSGALQPFTPVTLETLAIYGSSTLRFCKIGPGKYYLEF